MRALRFPFARVLRVRKLQEAEARASFLAARAAAEGARVAAVEAGTALASGRRELVDLQSSAQLAPLAVIAHQEALGGLERARARLEAAAAERERCAEAERVAWEARRAGVRGLEKLEQRRRAAHGAELERLEAREQDERALARAADSQTRGDFGALAEGPLARRSRPGGPPADEHPGALPGAPATPLSPAP